MRMTHLRRMVCASQPSTAGMCVWYGVLVMQIVIMKRTGQPQPQLNFIDDA